MNIFEFISKYQSQRLDDGNGGYLGECVSLIKRYIAENGWEYKHGNAIDWQNNGDDFYQWIPANTAIFPAAGDIVVFNISKYGHIGIAVSANPQTLDVFQQNDPVGSTARIKTYNYSKVVGWLHPKGNDMIDQNVVDGHLYKTEDGKLLWYVEKPETASKYFSNWENQKPLTDLVPAQVVTNTVTIEKPVIVEVDELTGEEIKKVQDDWVKSHPPIVIKEVITQPITIGLALKFLWDSIKNIKIGGSNESDQG